MVLFDKIGLILFHFAWQATVIAVITGLLLYLLKRAGSRTRYAVCCFSLLLMIVLPICFAFSNLIKDPYSFEGSANNQLTQVNAEEVFYNGKLIGKTYRTNPVQITSYDELIYYIKIYTPIISITWLLGVVLTTLYRIYGFSKIRALVRQGRWIVESSLEIKIKELMRKVGIKRVVTILQSPSIDTPAVIGFFKPVLLIPVSFLTGFEGAYIEAIILHELAHIKRYDYMFNFIQLIVETFGFFHPAVWWISNRIRRERENCCDDFAVEILGDRFIYVKSLVQLEEMRQHTSLVTAANGSSLSYRVSRLLGLKSNIYGSPFFNFAAASIVILFLIASLGFVIVKSNDGSSLSSLFKNITNSKIDDNLVAYFPFNGNAFDGSVVKHKIFLNNVFLCEDRFGKKNRALDFNGKNSYISTKKNEVNNAESITICSWVYPRRAENWESWICIDGPKWGSAWRVGFGENKNAEWGLTTCNLISGSNYWENYWIINSEVRLNKWTHVAVSADQDKNIVTLYMNGKKVGVLRDLRNFEKSEGAVRIGFQTDDNAYFDGKVDDIRIYDRVLTDEEIREVYDME